MVYSNVNNDKIVNLRKVLPLENAQNVYTYSPRIYLSIVFAWGTFKW